MKVITAAMQLAGGLRSTAELIVRVRFDLDWIRVRVRAELISGQTRPQALVDITPLSPVPALAVRECGICRGITQAGPSE
ncbi:hypothetical protein [Nocardia macrotermitis]|uniref:Uncharacterized protein n=1 Tax=Nocardia macrotermitis TaxID=2585198 RepID=A0A7K0DEY2_9NOCA|nr:hypothetical protein [Nocardia macrotermitis]MQY24353.1 hypothetical protein [Nocardia macrotermitis]